jgi:hypothetical protein
MRRSILTTVLILLAASIGCKQAEWREYRAEEYGFRISMPAYEQNEHPNLPLEGRFDHLYEMSFLWSIKDGRDHYDVWAGKAYYENDSALASALFRSLLANPERGFIRGSHEQTVKSNPFTIEFETLRKILGKYRIETTRIIANDSLFYILRFEAPGRTAPKKKLSRFFDSFELLE